MQAALQGGRLTRLTPIAKTARAETRHEHENSLPARSARPRIPHDASLDTGGRRVTGLDQPANNDEPREPPAPALRANLDAVNAPRTGARLPRGAERGARV